MHPDRNNAEYYDFCLRKVSISDICQRIAETVKCLRNEHLSTLILIIINIEWAPRLHLIRFWNAYLRVTSSGVITTRLNTRKQICNGNTHHLINQGNRKWCFHISSIAVDHSDGFLVTKEHYAVTD